MTRLPRVAPTPAAAVTYAALGTFVATYALYSWYDLRVQRGQQDWFWTIDPGTMLRESATWTAWVTLWCAVAWVVGRRHPWRVPVVTAVVAIGWTVLAWLSFRVEYQVTGWNVTWPGPVPGAAYGDPSDVYPYEPGVVVQPGVVTPVVVVAAVTVTTWLARRRSRTVPPTALTTTPRARLLVVAVLALPVVAAIAAASLLQLAPADTFATSTQRYVDVLVHPTFVLALTAGAALLLGGTGRAGWVLLGLISLLALGPLVRTWLTGGQDALLGTTALGIVAVGLAAAAHPIASAISRLDEPQPAPLAPSVPERADAHH
jgi:hypothetical protein